MGASAAASTEATRETGNDTSVRSALRAALEPVYHPLLLILAILAVEAIWAGFAGLTVTGGAIVSIQAMCMMICGTAWQAAARQAAHAGWRSSRAIQPAGEFVSNIGLYSLFACATAFLTYLVARWAQPLRDADLTALDATIGFDWLRWWSFVEHHPALKTVFHVAYVSLPAQIVVTCAVTPFCGDRRRASEFVWLALVTGIVTCIVSGVLPAIGAAAWHGVGHSPWVPDLHLLRAPGPATFEMYKLNGIVTFPSYHAVLAVLIAWANRRTGMIGIAFIAFNIVMIASTSSGGGHYLVDVIAGLLIATAAIVVSQRLRRFTPSVALG